MMIKVYKEFEAVQYDGSNSDEIKDAIGFEPSVFGAEVSDWLVYSPYKKRWKKYTNEEFKRDFKTYYQLCLSLKQYCYSC